jgi:hypothetical protein
MKRLLEYLQANGETMVLTFEIFWIVVFLLEAATGTSGAEVTGFVYANF